MAMLTRVSTEIATLKELSKSGIVTLVLISVLGGYFAGHPLEREFSLILLAETLFGVFFLASGSSVLNQLQERHIDALMPRTAGRPIPSGKISPAKALVLTFVFIGIGAALLSQISPEVLALGCLAVLSYNGLYTLWWKKHWAHAAVPGAIPGALPILMGYAAASGEVFTPGGLYLFFILFFWQMPHFWVLALRYKDDYKRGGFPTLPVALGQGVTVFQITLWCLAYVGLAMIAPVFLRVSGIYCLVAFAMSCKVLWELRKFSMNPDADKSWLWFFLWINFSLIVYIAAAVADLWSVYPQAWWQG